MKKWLLLVCLLATLPTSAAVLTAPAVLSCPEPLWVTSCPSATYLPVVLTDATHQVASASKTTPVWAHTLSWYADHDPTVPLVVCPAGAILGADARACLSAAGTDASVLITRSAIAAPAPPPAVQMAAYTITSTTSPELTVTFSALDALVSQCFTLVSGTRKVATCVPPAVPKP